LSHFSVSETAETLRDRVR